MIQENKPNPAPRFARVSALRSSRGASISESVDRVDILLNQELNATVNYIKVDVNKEWVNFSKIINFK